jgi:phytoene synthase
MNDLAGRIAHGYRTAKEVTRRHARSFYFASVFLFGARRRAAFALYACCRRLDDLVDEAKNAGRAARLRRARGILSELYRSYPALADPRGPFPLLLGPSTELWPANELLALSDAVGRFSIPEAPFQDLISGMEMDLTPRRYANFSELDLYCHRVAGTVGLLLAPVLGATEPDAAVPAARLGKAMQLTNILRDVREDLARGRLYLPLEELEAFGVTEAELREGRVTPQFRSLMRAQIARARALYAQAAAGVPFLKGPANRALVRLMGAIYGEILRDIERRDYDVFFKRARVPARRKLALALRVVVRPATVLKPPAAEPGAPALPVGSAP